MVSILLPSYQEADNLRAIIPQIEEALKDISHEIVVVDTLEPMDKTAEVCRDYQVRYVNRKGGNLYGDAIRTGFQEVKGKYTVVMDADGSHSPADIPRFYHEMETGKYDLIIGSRYCKGGKTDNSLLLIAMSKILNITYRIVFSLPIKDVSDSFRMYRSEQIKSLSLACNNFDIVEEILIRLRLTKKNFSISEVPVIFHKRAAGKSKRSLIKFIFSYLQTMKRLMKIKKGYI